MSSKERKKKKKKKKAEEKRSQTYKTNNGARAGIHDLSIRRSQDSRLG